MSSIGPALLMLGTALFAAHSGAAQRQRMAVDGIWRDVADPSAERLLFTTGLTFCCVGGLFCLVLVLVGISCDRAAHAANAARPADRAADAMVATDAAPPAAPAASAIVVEGVVVTDLASAPRVTLAERTEALRRELGLSPAMSIHEVIQQAAAQLGVVAEGKPLTEVAALCTAQLGVC